MVLNLNKYASDKFNSTTVLPGMSLLLLTYILFTMTFKLSSFPGLHGDEAWSGLRAIEMIERGFFTLHGLNYYTGAIHSYLLSIIFQGMGISVFSIRTVSIFFNILAILIFLYHLKKRFASESVFLFLILLSGNLMLLFYARLGWEVCAYNFFLTTLALVTVHVFLKRQLFPKPALFLFFSANFMGCLNHFIFISVPLSFFIGSTLLLLFGIEWKNNVKFFFLNLLSIFFIYLLYRTKLSMMDDQFFLTYKYTIIAVLVALPFIEVCIFYLFENIFEKFVECDSFKAFVEKVSFQNRLIKYCKCALLGICLVAVIYYLGSFIRFQGEGFTGALANVILLKRIFSYIPSSPFVFAAYSFAGAVLVLYILDLTVAIKKFLKRELGEFSLFMVILPLVYLSSLVILTRFSSLRYFMIACILLFSSLAMTIPFVLKRKIFISFLLLGVAFATFSHILVWKNISHVKEKEPVRFSIGMMGETSAHFIETKSLFDYLKEKNVCSFGIADRESLFIVRPLLFYKEAENYTCNSTKTAFIMYCSWCTDPPGFRITYASQ